MALCRIDPASIRVHRSAAHPEQITESDQDGGRHSLGRHSRLDDTDEIFLDDTALDDTDDTAKMDDTALEDTAGWTARTTQPWTTRPWTTDDAQPWTTQPWTDGQ